MSPPVNVEDPQTGAITNHQMIIQKHCPYNLLGRRLMMKDA